MIPESVHIMLVEDDEIDVMSIKRAFKYHNIANPLHVADNGQVALDMLKGTAGTEKLTPTPKILLLDVNMPVMNGIEFLQAIRNDEELKSMTVFVLTTSDGEQDKLSAYKLNVAGYIVKPVEFSSLLEAVAELNLYWKLIEMPS